MRQIAFGPLLKSMAIDDKGAELEPKRQERGQMPSLAAALAFRHLLGGDVKGKLP
jgi:hypothetical protein